MSLKGNCSMLGTDPHREFVKKGKLKIFPPMPPPKKYKKIKNKFKKINKNEKEQEIYGSKGEGNNYMTKNN